MLFSVFCEQTSKSDWYWNKEESAFQDQNSLSSSVLLSVLSAFSSSQGLLWITGLFFTGRDVTVRMVKGFWSYTQFWIILTNASYFFQFTLLLVPLAFYLVLLWTHRSNDLGALLPTWSLWMKLKMCPHPQGLEIAMLSVAWQRSMYWQAFKTQVAQKLLEETTVKLSNIRRTIFLVPDRRPDKMRAEWLLAPDLSGFVLQLRPPQKGIFPGQTQK